MRDYDGRLARLAARAFDTDQRRTWLRQLRSATLLEQVRHPDTPRPAFTFDPVHVAQAADLVRLAELTRTGRERRRDPGQLPTIAQAYTDLAAAHPGGTPRRLELLAVAASTWSLAGYQANAAKLASDYLAEIDLAAGTAPAAVPVLEQAAPAAIAVLVGVILRRDLGEVTRLGALAEETLPRLGTRMLAAAGSEPLDRADAAVLAAYGLLGRAARALARFWRRGERAAGTAALTDLRQAAQLVLQANIVDTWVLLDNLAHVVEDAVATSPWRLLRRAPTWNGRWERYLRARALAQPPVVQVWPSQRQVLEAGLLDADQPHLTVTMPTSAGKTHLAEWAILHALAVAAAPGRLPKLAVYIVPSRALASEVERHLAASLGPLALRVSGLFGGAEHVGYELQLLATTDVLVVTSEKFDLLLRNDPDLAERLALVVVDEGHLLGEGERGLRLELVVTRVRQISSAARLLILSAVLPNVDDVAAWLDPQRPHLAAVNWSPSQLNMGVFTWKGRKADGQQGFVEYRSSDADHAFFLPYVLSRHQRRTKLFPEETKDVAAELALHYQQLGLVLIAVPKKASTATVARAVRAAADRADVVLGADDSGLVPPDLRAHRDRVIEVITEYAGADHELVALVGHGIGYHHADIPEAIRQELEKAYRAGALRVLAATSTLGQGVNLPAKTVIVAGIHRGRDDRLSVRDFLNIAGRAARPFRETEGHVILIAKTEDEARALRRRYIDSPELEPIWSTLIRLYVTLVRARLGSSLPQGRDVPADLELLDPDDGTAAAEWAAIVDLQLLALLAEEVVGTDDETLLTAAVDQALGATLAAVQLGDYPLAPLTRFASRRMRALAVRIPDGTLRATYLRTGLSLDGCASAQAGARHLAALVDLDPGLLTEERWPELRTHLLHQALTVAELQRSALREKLPDLTVLVELATDWMDGLGVDELRHRHGTRLALADPMRFAKVLDRLIVHDLAWVLSAMLQLWEHERPDLPLTGPISACAAMAKYGVSSEPACFAASIGVRNRRDAVTLGQLYPAAPGQGFPHFVTWAATLTSDAVAPLVSARTAQLFLQRAAALITPRTALDLAIQEAGTVIVPVRGIAALRTASFLAVVDDGEEVLLRRERGNAADPQAIAVYLTADVKIGYVAREVAQVIAPLLDLEDGPVAHAALDPLPGRTSADLERRDAVTIRITIR
ncbi:DEAD/DEAH box helicase [Streptosporangium amethystogenes]|uniref:DEAD/DEAH box helicase n=1 Tax=Streptosporangium amethystogenes TaxID=2002 RepID=UPI0004C57C07|nr:DEAD/DEAH box helicase [Streptosporangium amethystogenes]